MGKIQMTTNDILEVEKIIRKILKKELTPTILKHKNINLSQKQINHLINAIDFIINDKIDNYIEIK